MSSNGEIIRTALRIVAEECEVMEHILLSKCRKMEVVDARHILAKLLHRAGVYPTRIAEALGITHRNVGHILAGFDDRAKYSPPMRNNYARALKKFGDTLETIA